MRGNGRLRVTPVGEVRHRWAAVLADEEDKRLSCPVTEEESSEDEGNTDELEWVAQVPSPRRTLDPMSGLRPEGSCSRFWEDATNAPSLECQLPKTPSTASLCKKAALAGFSSVRIEEVSALLADPECNSKIISALTLSSMDRPVSMARQIMNTLFEGRIKTTGVWKGPLPPARVSPLLTLGDCPVRDRHGEARSLPASERR